jgi:hypothetical protein
MLERMSEDETFLNGVCFSHEATFHVSGKLNTHNVRIWGLENPHVTRELQRDSPKVNVWCGIMCNRIIGPFSSKEPNDLIALSWLLAPKNVKSFQVLQAAMILQCRTTM